MIEVSELFGMSTHEELVREVGDELDDVWGVDDIDEYAVQVAMDQVLEGGFKKNQVVSPKVNIISDVLIQPPLVVEAASTSATTATPGPSKLQTLLKLPKGPTNPKAFYAKKRKVTEEPSTSASPRPPSPTIGGKGKGVGKGKGKKKCNVTKAGSKKFLFKKPATPSPLPDFFTQENPKSAAAVAAAVPTTTTSQTDDSPELSCLSQQCERDIIVGAKRMCEMWVAELDMSEREEGQIKSEILRLQEQLALVTAKSQKYRNKLRLFRNELNVSNKE